MGTSPSNISFIPVAGASTSASASTSPRQSDLDLVRHLCAIIRAELETRGLTEAVLSMLTRMGLVIRFDREYSIHSDVHTLSLHAHATSYEGVGKAHQGGKGGNQPVG